EFFAADVEAVAGPGLDLITLPKVDATSDIHAAAEALARAERTYGLTRRIGILATIETPRALRRAAEIACADPRMAGLQIGYADLLEPLGIDRANQHAVQFTRVAVRFAAAEAGIAAYDGIVADVSRPDIFRAEAEAARRLGFTGMTCIHPTQ